MMKKLIAATAVVLFMSGAAFSQEMKMCDDKTVKMVMAEVEGAPTDKKEMAMAEFNKAKMEMEASNSKDCAKHLEKASKLSMKP
ncbi:MAG: hypothetical protein L3J32_12490 [Rhizobiaceae bacterium]|nr:hypothetical protein [Rhizobiaceae bacterium]